MSSVRAYVTSFGQFSVEKRTFSYPPPLNPKFENVFLALHPPNFVGGKPRHRAKKFSPKTYPLTSYIRYR